MGLNFDTTKSGAIYHISYSGEGNKYTENETVPLVYTGFYFSKSNAKIYFVESDTFNLNVGDRNILEGWNEIAKLISEGASGIIIFPYNIAFQNNQTPNIDPNSTLYFYFRIASDNYHINQNALFWNYVEKYDSILTIYDDSLCYAKYFDGLGDVVSPTGTQIDYIMVNIYDTIYASSSSFFAEPTNINLTQGLISGLSKMREGEMGLIMVPPSLAYTQENVYGIKPYSALVYEVRAISSDPEVEEISKIDKFLYINQTSPDSILNSGIYYFVDDPNTDEEASDAFLGATISYSDSLFLINTETPIQSCQGCTAIVNSTNFDPGILQCILAMKEGEKATFIIPYSQGYGSSGTTGIPPYSTLLYQIELDIVE